MDILADAGYVGGRYLGMSRIRCVDVDRLLKASRCTTFIRSFLEMKKLKSCSGWRIERTWSLSLMKYLNSGVRDWLKRLAVIEAYPSFSRSAGNLKSAGSADSWRRNILKNYKPFDELGSAISKLRENTEMHLKRAEARKQRTESTVK